MDFNTLVAGPAGLSRVAADALLVVLVGDAAPKGLDKALSAALAASVDAGDIAFKPGKTLLLHRVPRVDAARVAFATAADGSAKAFAKAAASGLGLLKSGGTKHVAVALAGAGEPTAAHAEALAAAAADVAYLYRHTKPSAPKAPLMAQVSLLCSAAARADADAGLARGAAIAEGVTLARECA